MPVSIIQDQTIAILRHDLNLSDKTQLTTAISFQTGRNGTSGLDWYDARDPRPDYYRNLPSYVLDDVQKAAITEKLMSDEAADRLTGTICIMSITMRKKPY